MARAAAADDVPMMQLIAKMQAANDERNPFMLARSLFIEWVYYGPDVLNYAWSFAPLVERWEATAEMLPGLLQWSQDLT